MSSTSLTPVQNNSHEPLPLQEIKTRQAADAQGIRQPFQGLLQLCLAFRREAYTEGYGVDLERASGILTRVEIYL
jgi:hypothetical protein